MPIPFQCPHCRTVYEVADDLAGKFIMCRGCQKRGPVRTLSGSAAVAAGAAATGTRRNFLAIAGWSLASIGAIATGALLARRPWRTLTPRPRGSERRDRRGPRDSQDKGSSKDSKQGA